MGEVYFYHLTTSPIEVGLPRLVELSLGRGWRVILRFGSDAALAAADAMLWTYRDDSFLPHGGSAGGHAQRQPVYLTTGDEIPNGADVLMLLEGGSASPEELAAFVRTCLIFDGHDPRAVEAARAEWRAVRNAGLKAVYWAQERGSWVRKADN